MKPSDIEIETVLWMALHSLQDRGVLGGDDYWTAITVRVDAVPDDLWVEIAFDGFYTIKVADTNQPVNSGRLKPEMMKTIRELLPVGDKPKPMTRTSGLGA